MPPSGCLQQSLSDRTHNHPTWLSVHRSRVYAFVTVASRRYVQLLWLRARPIDRSLSELRKALDMRFLDTRTCTFVELDPKWTKFAILSHTWNQGGEQSYNELRRVQERYNPDVRCSWHGTEEPPPRSLPSLEKSAVTTSFSLPTPNPWDALAITPPRSRPVSFTGESATLNHRPHSAGGNDTLDDDSATANSSGSFLGWSMGTLW